LEQGVEREFLLDADAAAPHRRGEFWVPRCRHGLAGKWRKRMRRRRYGFVGQVVIAPRLPAHPVTHRAGDPDTAPVEVAVVSELRTAGCEQFQQPPPGGRRLAANAYQRLAPGRSE